jgi:hypothetical protein
MSELTMNRGFCSMYGLKMSIFNKKIASYTFYSILLSRFA